MSVVYSLNPLVRNNGTQPGANISTYIRGYPEIELGKTVEFLDS